MRGKLKKMMDNDQSDGYKGMSTHAEVMKLRRATELVETQSVESVRRLLRAPARGRARSSGASKASQRMVADPKVREAMRKAEAFDGLHPKFSKARILLAETLGINEGERAILFTESRDTAEALVEFLSTSFDVRKFVGQGDKEGSDGMSQKQQQETLDEFKAGDFEVLVSHERRRGGARRPRGRSRLFLRAGPDRDPLDPAQGPDRPAGRGESRRPDGRRHPRRGVLLDLAAPREEDGQPARRTEGSDRRH